MEKINVDFDARQWDVTFELGLSINCCYYVSLVNKSCCIALFWLQSPLLVRSVNTAVLT